MAIPSLDIYYLLNKLTYVFNDEAAAIRGPGDDLLVFWVLGLNSESNSYFKDVEGFDQEGRRGRFLSGRHWRLFFNTIHLIILLNCNIQLVKKAAELNSQNILNRKDHINPPMPRE